MGDKQESKICSMLNYGKSMDKNETEERVWVVGRGRL